MRASAAVEKAGIPTASLVCDGFVGQADAIIGGLGVEVMAIARLPGHVDAQTDEQLRTNVLETTLPQIIVSLTEPPSASASTQRALNELQQPAKPRYIGERIAAEGDERAINEAFEANGWTDGLPIVPPTPERVGAFLRQVDDDPDRIIGPLQPSGCGATPLNVAINAVMANCRPEYMPVAMAIAEVLCDPGYGAEHSGDTTGGDALVIVSGPVVDALKFNCENGALRDGFRVNTSLGRFLRLMLRNVAGFIPGAADKATFGHTFRVVLAEHESAVSQLGWPTFSQERGFAAGTSSVTVARFTAGGTVGSLYGRDPETIFAYLGDALVRQTSWEFVFTAGFAPGTYRPLLVISPMIASTLASQGLSRADVREGLFRHARLPAERLERYIGPWTNLVPGRQTLTDLVAAGKAAPQFATSEDPARLVPIVDSPDDLLLVVSGDPLRSNAYAFASNGMHGFPTSRAIPIFDE